MCSFVKGGFLLLCFICLNLSTFIQASKLSCGRRKIQANYLVHAGIEAAERYWPWHVAIFNRDVYQCGGSIIDENTILTAAHCVFSSGSLSTIYMSVHVGRVHLNKTTEHTQLHDVQDVIVYPEFSRDRITHDIALIKLSTNITMNKYVQPVCLWAMDSKQELIAGKNGTIVGFGIDERDQITEHLKQANVSVIDPLICIQSDRQTFGNLLTENMLCGKGPVNVSACNGDSGGGMFFERADIWFVRGLVSYNAPRVQTYKCDPLKPTAFTDVAKYMDWIKQYIDERVILHNNDVLQKDFEEKLPLFNFETCGLRSTHVYDSKNWTTPWISFVVVEKSQGFYCTTTLITEWYAIGPASCFDMIEGDKKILINLGTYFSWECHNQDPERVCAIPDQQRQIQKVIKHPQFNSNNYAHNIALIELKTPADTTQPNVNPICLPVTSEQRTNAESNLLVGVMYVEGVENIPLRSVESIKCTGGFGEDTRYVENHILCAEKAIDNKNRTCRSHMPGSPLLEMRLLDGSERFFLIGLDLLGSTCQTKQPTVFMNVEPYIPWILYNMRYKTREVTTYTNQRLVSEWITLQQQRGKEKLRLFSMDTCGAVPRFSQSIRDMPWIGYLVYDLSKSHLYTNQVVLISDWYALAPKSVLHKGLVWRFVFFGNYDGSAEYKQVWVEIKKMIIPPPEHRRQTFALIELLESIYLNIEPICLPFMNSLNQLQSKDIIMTKIELRSINSNNLTVMDRSSCEQRLLWNGVSSFNETSACAATKQTSTIQHLEANLGSAFQMQVHFDNRSPYFLYGMNVHESDEYNSTQYGLYLFEKIELADLEWIMENMEEKQYTPAFPTISKTNHVNLTTFHISSSKMPLFDLNNCGVSSTNFPLPWIGYTSRCKVILINEWFVVGPASCFSDDKNEAWVKFGYYFNLYDPVEYDSSINIKSIFRHPNYTGAEYVNDIALAQLASPVNTSLPSMKPICLPIIDQARSYDISSLTIRSATKKVEDKYVDPRECQKRWKGLKANVTIDISNHCVIAQRSMGEKCVLIGIGDSFHSRQTIGLTERSFLRGFALDKGVCSIYYPVVYTNTDTYLGWILETMDQKANRSDRRKELISSDAVEHNISGEQETGGMSNNRVSRIMLTACVWTVLQILGHSFR